MASGPPKGTNYQSYRIAQKAVASGPPKGTKYQSHRTAAPKPSAGLLRQVHAHAGLQQDLDDLRRRKLTRLRLLSEVPCYYVALLNVSCLVYEPVSHLCVHANIASRLGRPLSFYSVCNLKHTGTNDTPP